MFNLLMNFTVSLNHQGGGGDGEFVYRGVQQLPPAPSHQHGGGGGGGTRRTTFTDRKLMRRAKLGVYEIVIGP